MSDLLHVHTFSFVIAAVVAWGGLFLASPATPAVLPVQAQEVACEDLAAPGLFPNTTITFAELVVSAGVQNCRVAGVIHPTLGSSIGVEYRLPTNWNGKFLGLGGGGFGGSISSGAFNNPLQRGYAAAQTNIGHTPADGVNWALIADGVPHADRVTDYAWRSVEQMTVIGKQIVEHYYGRGPELSYWQGCSTGGRQGLVMAQRYPDYYDGIIAGAPVYTTRLQTRGVWEGSFLFAPGGMALSEDTLDLISEYVVNKYDGMDGVEDGIIDDPTRIKSFDPAEIDALSPAEVELARRMYEGPRLADGTHVYPGRWPGSETQWPAAASYSPNGISPVMLRTMVVYDAGYDEFQFNLDTDLKMWDDAPVSDPEGNAGDPDIREFVNRGGKLLMYHGWNDGGPNPQSTIDYLEAVEEVVGKDKQIKTGNPDNPADRVRESVRLFMAPGMNHCGGGVGPNSFDTLTALESWVEDGTPPDRIIARNNARDIERPLCPFPEVARYVGAGDTSDAGSFVCVRGPGQGSGAQGQ
jgi:pimeloyl-ACP methyl ester carboxylesterase